MIQVICISKRSGKYRYITTSCLSTRDKFYKLFYSIKGKEYLGYIDTRYWYIVGILQVN